MSLGCGACRSSIYGSFGLLYRLPREADGSFRLPNSAEDYVPPNSAVCEPCWARVPKERVLQNLDALGSDFRDRYIYAYAPADSGRGASGGAQWSSIESDTNNLIFLHEETAMELLPQAVRIIWGMGDAEAQTVLANENFASSKKDPTSMDQLITPVAVEEYFYRWQNDHQMWIAVIKMGELHLWNHDFNTGAIRLVGPEWSGKAAESRIYTLDTAFVNRVLAYFESTGTHADPLRVVKMQQLALGAIAVLDSMSEYDVYFDRKMWKATHPKVWSDDKKGCNCSGLFPPGLKGTGIGVLPGLGRAPNVSSFVDAYFFAQQELTAKTGTNWHARPKDVPLPAHA